MLRRIAIDGYKSFRKFELRLEPLTIVFGPNASGKSNLLDALYLVSRAATQRNLKEAFEGHRGLPLESFYYGAKGYEALYREQSVEFAVEVDIELSPSVVDRVEEMIRVKRGGIDPGDSKKQIITERRLRYRLKIEALPVMGYLRVKEERLCAIKSNGEEKKGRNPFLEVEGGRIVLRMEGQSHPFYHDVGLDYTIVSTALYEPHYPHITAFRTELANWYAYYLEPRALMREDVPLAEIESLGPRGENLAAFLNTLKNKAPKDYENLNLTLATIMPSRAMLDVRILKEGLVGLQLIENGATFSSRLISEGTLRLIGLLAAIHPRNPATLVAFEEPENGVHPVRIKLICEVLERSVMEYGKQVIITTHSPILPECFNDRSLFVSRREENETKITPFRSDPGFFRRPAIDHALEDRILRGDFGG